MVKDISRKYIRLPLGSVSISVEDLINIIEQKGFKKVSAENNDAEFESLDDIKSHKTLMVGFPKLRCDEIFISFEKHFSGVSVYEPKDESSIVTARSIHNEISKYKSFLDLLSDWSRYTYLSFFIMASVWIAVNSYYEKGEIPNLIEWFMLFLKICLLLFIPFHLWKGYADLVRRRIYYNPSQGIFRKRLEEIVMLTIGAVIAVAVTKLDGLIFGAN